MTNDDADAIGDFARDAIRRANDAVEAGVERMLVTPGDYGLRVYQWVDDRATLHVRTELTADVPAMTIEQHNYAPEGDDRA